MNIDVPIDRFEYCSKDILERLYKETEIVPSGGLDKYLKLQPTEQYLKNKNKEKENVKEEPDDIVNKEEKVENE
jgi:hypothetical protein